MPHKWLLFLHSADGHHQASGVSRGVGGRPSLPDSDDVESDRVFHQRAILSPGPERRNSTHENGQNSAPIAAQTRRTKRRAVQVSVARRNGR